MKPNLVALDTALQNLAQADDRLLVVTADSRISGRLQPFCERFPDRVVEVGIAEQNLVGTAAGLASCGWKPFVISQAAFLTARSLEQIKIDVGYCQNAVALVGISAGISYGPLGATHHAIGDIAAVRPIPELSIVVPSDNCDTAIAAERFVRSPKPTYIRLGKLPVPCIHDTTANPALGTTRFGDGGPVGVIATGEMAQVAFDAVRELGRRGTGAEALAVPVIRPFPEEEVLRLAARSSVLLTIEEHSVTGGLGELCARLVAQVPDAPVLHVCGLPETPIINGQPLEVLAHAGVSSAAVADRAEGALEQLNAAAASR